ncbi:hypothetical protein K470DRAFT_256450 [Piedraia hortae CBS 480.64]|uniref:UBA domain-containing protein n=1 Tax=Piedraia hortae CBS 480.64 TaxID=1314780 RepID=A0A6A7C4D3_9PEZI|nr:hypothetical protein K470DRAFT_256450 [Piedraia hortae CBS 480.64]
MAAEPTDEQVAMLQSVCECDDRALVVRALKACRNDTNEAANMIFSNNVPPEDLNVMSAEHVGDIEEGQVEETPSKIPSLRTPPSRRPSRTSMRPQNSTYDESEGKQLKQFGVQLGTCLPSSSTEKPFSELPEQRVLDRMIGHNEPRMLKPTDEAQYLANFLTICHFTPGARNDLLWSLHKLEYYGQHDMWWRGSPISSHRFDSSGTENTPASDVVAEVQRLMAYLDISDRSYASIMALVQIAALKDHNSRQSPIELFLTKWLKAIEQLHDEPRDSIFQLRPESIPLSGEESSTEHAADTCFVRLDLSSLPEGNDKDLAMVLYSYLSESEKPNQYFRKPQGLLVFELCRTGANRLDMQAPYTLYVDGFEDVANSAGEMGPLRKRSQLLRTVREKLENYKMPEDGNVDALTMSTMAVKFLSGDNLPVDEGLEARPEHHAKLAKRLEQVNSNIQARIAEIKSAEAETLSRIRKLVNPKEGKQRYTLYGIATKPNAMYILQPCEDEEHRERTHDEPASNMQWWRLDFQQRATGASVNKNTVDHDTVLQAIGLEHDEALLVYASDEVASADPKPLSQELKDFITADNALFATEMIDAETAGHEATTPSPKQMFPGSRRRQNSMDSMIAMNDSDSNGDSPFRCPVPLRVPGGDMDMSADDPANEIVHEIKLDDKPMEMVEK